LRAAQQALEAEENTLSRLFVVDAGLDQARLRQQYPDRSHYAIVHGTVRPEVAGAPALPKLYGTVTAVSCESIHVPLEFRTAVSSAAISRGDPTSLLRRLEAKPRLALQVAFGRRLEPWVVSAEP
jgi:hypothetical protein